MSRLDPLAWLFESLKKNVIALIDEVEKAEEFPPTESALCRYCSYQDICPLFAHEFRTDVLPPSKYLKEDGVVLVNRLAELDAKKRELRADIAVIEEEWDAVVYAAIEFAQRTGVSRLFGSDRELTIKDDIEIEYPKSGDEERDGFEAALKGLGVWDQLTGLNHASFKAFAKKGGWPKKIPEEVEEFVTVTPAKKATLSRRKDEPEVM